MPKSMADYNYKLGTSFTNMNNFKGAIRTYIVDCGRKVEI